MSIKIKICLIYFLSFTVFRSSSQQIAHKVYKPSIDTSILDKWPKLTNNVVLSNDGNYLAYIVDQKSFGKKLFIKGLNNNWKKEFTGIEDEQIYITSNSKYIIFKKQNTLVQLVLGAEDSTLISGINSFKISNSENGIFLAYTLKDNPKELLIKNLNTNHELKYSSVINYWIEKNGKAALIIKEKKQDSAIEKSVLWVSLDNGNERSLWSVKCSLLDDTKVLSGIFNFEGDQVAFIVKNKNENAIWYYKEGIGKAINKLHNQSPGIDINLQIGESISFSRNGNWIFFELQKRMKSFIGNVENTKVSVWSYKDITLYPRQIENSKYKPLEKYAAVVSTRDDNVVQLENENQKLQPPLQRNVTGDYALIVDKKEIAPSWWPHLEDNPKYWALSFKDGHRNFVNIKNKGIFSYRYFSPKGRYLIYWDAEEACFFSYNFLTTKSVNITKGIPTSLAKDYILQVDPVPVGPIAGWIGNDSALILYDNYDIWLVDIDGKKAPVNLTNGYGRKNNIKLRLTYEYDLQDNYGIIDNDATLLLTGFNTANKYNGFFRKKIGDKGNPKLLTIGPYMYYRLGSQKPASYSFSNGMAPVKARDIDGWIVRRESEMEAPNYFYTKDFKNFNKVSNIEPQVNYNWLTTELITWKMFDGRMCHGILYKPENFNPHERYPVIFNFYEATSHALHEFAYPFYTTTNINIPWFVSNGYLVFTPDIHFDVAAKSGKTAGEYAYNSIVSAAQHLAKFQYIDSKKMAIQGHSFGGLEASYLVTHTNVFAAACEAAGYTDPISSYLTLFLSINRIESEDKQEYIEKGHQLYGTSPWERPELYRRNSAVLNVDKATTPLLIMHNVKDANVQWRQGLELFMAMRRLGKACWMLQYEDGDHGVFQKDAIDFTIRLTQFFDHYLKGMPPPRWMTNNKSTLKNEEETDFSFDLKGKCYKNCSVCNRNVKGK